MVIGWVKTAWECIPEEMVLKSYSSVVFLGKGIAETVADARFWTTAGTAFLWMTRMIPILRDFNNIIRQKIL